jgi:hypothetical protein
MDNFFEIDGFLYFALLLLNKLLIGNKDKDNDKGRSKDKSVIRRAAYPPNRVWYAKWNSSHGLAG